MSGRGSELLDEDAEPFEVAPGAMLSAPLVAALRVLFAGADAFAAWSGLDDALAGWPTRLTAGKGAGAPVGPGTTNTNPPDEAGSEISEGGSVGAEDGSEPGAQLGSVSVADAAGSGTGSGFLAPAALGALGAALRTRLGAYGRGGRSPEAPTLAAELAAPEVLTLAAELAAPEALTLAAELAAAEAGAAAARGPAAREAAGARVAALRLVLGETRLLAEALAALDRLRAPSQDQQRSHGCDEPTVL